MNLRRIFALALVPGLLWASPAFAQDEEDPEPEVSDEGPENMYERLLAVSATGGWDTPFGVGGAAIEFAPIPYINIYAGGGASRSGARVAGGVNFRAPVHSTAFGLQLGVAGGPMDWQSSAIPASADTDMDPINLEQVTLNRYWEFALFLHAGMNVEYRWDEGIFGRFSFGAEALIAGDLTECRVEGAGMCDGEVVQLPQPIRGWVGLTVGYAFEL